MLNKNIIISYHDNCCQKCKNNSYLADITDEEIDQAGNHWSHQQRIGNPLSNQATGQGLLTFIKVFITNNGLYWFLGCNA